MNTDAFKTGAFVRGHIDEVNGLSLEAGDGASLHSDWLGKFEWTLV